MDELRLQVYLCTFGRAGMDRMAKKLHPRHPGVEYVISRQLREEDSEDEVWPEIEAREDYRVINSRTKGIAVNRNIALRDATAPIALITDDDIQFHPHGLDTIIADFEARPEADVISFKFTSDAFQKPYPDYEFNLKHMPRFFYVSAMEIAMRPDRVRRRVQYNESFGFNTDFYGGEDDIFSIDCVQAGLVWLFVPHTVMHHPGLSTGTKPDPEYALVETRGAVFGHVHPHTWPLRLVWRAYWDTGKGTKYRYWPYVHHWLKGWRKSRRLKVFTKK